MSTSIRISPWVQEKQKENNGNGRGEDLDPNLTAYSLDSRGQDPDPPTKYLLQACDVSRGSRENGTAVEEQRNDIRKY